MPVKKLHTALWLAAFLMLLNACTSWTTWETQQLFPSASGVVIKTVQIRDFKSPRRGAGRNLAQAIAAGLQREGFVSVVSRQGEGTLNGNVDWGRLNAEQWTSTYEYKEEVHTRYHYKYRKSLTVSYDLVANGHRYGDTLTESFEKEQSSSENYSQAKAALPEERAIDAQLLERVVTRIVRSISPHNAAVTYKLKTGETPHLKTGIEYTRMGRLDQALSIFQQVADATDNNRDRAAAIYNMGIIHEARGEVDAAFSFYRDANQLHLEEKLYPEAITRLESVQARLAELKRQTQ